MSSYYKQINNVKYDRNVLEMAANLQAGQGDGRISKADAKALSSAVYDGFNASVRTGTEDKTVRKVYDTANFTPAGRDTFEHANRSAGAKNGWKTRRANASKGTPVATQAQTATQSQAPLAQQAPVASQQSASPIASQIAVRISQQS